MIFFIIIKFKENKMSQGFHDDINQGLKKIGAQYSSIDEKQ